MCTQYKLIYTYIFAFIILAHFLKKVLTIVSGLDQLLNKKKTK